MGKEILMSVFLKEKRKKKQPGGEILVVFQDKGISFVLKHLMSFNLCMALLCWVLLV